jgi:hypothetical protein
VFGLAIARKFVARAHWRQDDAQISATTGMRLLMLHRRVAAARR